MIIPAGSPPSRRRGLKDLVINRIPDTDLVASFAEAWIESIGKVSPDPVLRVASFAEAWIEIYKKNQ